MTAEEIKTEATVVEEKPKPEEPKIKLAKPEAEKQTNCLSCGKPIKKLKRYYRDGKFYCTKKCWRQFISKAKEKTK